MATETEPATTTTSVAGGTADSVALAAEAATASVIL
jgi:hypothetical protein